MEVQDPYSPHAVVEDFTVTLRDDVFRVGLFASIARYGGADPKEEVKVCVGRIALTVASAKVLHAALADMLQKADALRAGGSPH